MKTGPKPFGTISTQWTWDRYQKREREKDARRLALMELDRFMADQRKRIQGRLQGMGHRIQAARRGGEYGDEVIVTEKRA